MFKHEYFFIIPVGKQKQILVSLHVKEWKIYFFRKTRYLIHRRRTWIGPIEFEYTDYNRIRNDYSAR